MPGMFARLVLPLGHSRGILIPQAAVKTVGQLTMVKVAVDQTAQLRQVKLGRQNRRPGGSLAGLSPATDYLPGNSLAAQAHKRPCANTSASHGTAGAAPHV